MPMSAGVNIGLTIISRGEFSIVMASLARTGGLLPLIQPFTALYVLSLSILGPLLTKESGTVSDTLTGTINLLKKRIRLRHYQPKHEGEDFVEEDSRIPSKEPLNPGDDGSN
jgi:CPA2 family monovalent cation:H+ antiporter-2